MFPCHVVDRCPSRSLMYVHASCDFGGWDALGRPLPHLLDLLLIQLCRWVSLAASNFTLFLTTFVDHVVHIIGICTRKQVIWVHAWWIIALVAHKQIIGYWAIVQLVRNTVGAHALASAGDHAIACSVCLALPQPAIIRIARDYVFPKFHMDHIISLSVALTKGLWFTFERAAFYVCGSSKGCLFSASALTQAIRMLEPALLDPRSDTKFMLPGIVTVDKAKRFAFGLSVFVASLDGNLGFPAASTLAVAVRDFVRGIIGVHENLHFSCRARTLQRRWLFLLGCYKSILPQVSQ